MVAAKRIRVNQYSSSCVAIISGLSRLIRYGRQDTATKTEMKVFKIILCKRFRTIFNIAIVYPRYVVGCLFPMTIENPATIGSLVYTCSSISFSLVVCASLKRAAFHAIIIHYAYNRYGGKAYVRRRLHCAGKRKNGFYPVCDSGRNA